MPKLFEHVRFPQSKQLFRFCFYVLELRRPSQKVNDQHLGQILNLTPSDTSHWKRGKKIIKDINQIQALAHNLNIDLEILQDLADGSMGFDEALYDFYDAEEESFLLKNTSHHMCHTSAKTLEKFASSILDQILIVKNIPLCVDKLINAFPFIQLLPSDNVNKLATSTRIKPGSYVIRYSKGHKSPHTRLAITREIATIILASERERYSFLSNSDQLTRSEVIALSNAFLMPGLMIAHEMQKISTRHNLVKSLAEKFVVPKSAVRKRLTTLLNQVTAYHPMA